MSSGKQQIRDMRYGRQGGRVVAFEDRPSLAGKPCDVCGQPMLGFQKNRHHMCDPTSIVGRICTCPPHSQGSRTRHRNDRVGC